MNSEFERFSESSSRYHFGRQVVVPPKDAATATEPIVVPAIAAAAASPPAPSAGTAVPTAAIPAAIAGAANPDRKTNYLSI